MTNPKILDDLNIREKLYSKYRAVNIPKKQAAVKAGYKEKSAQHQAWQLEKRPKIQLAIDYYRDKVIEEADMEVKDVINRIQQIARKQGIYQEKADNKTSLKALEDLAKILGVRGLTDRVIIETSPIDKIEREDIVEFLKSGRVPKGEGASAFQTLFEAISGTLPTESGRSN